MDMEGLRCHGCGSTNVEFDPKHRILRCHQCGKEEYYSRATLNANGKVVFARQNAMRFFTDGKLDDAHHYAMEVLNISADNATALFILAYHDEFTARKPDAMKHFFAQIREVPLEYEEVQDVCKLCLVSAYNLSDFEESVIELVATNMQSPEDAQELCNFIDAFCPYQIARRSSTAFLTDNLAGMYRELAGHCGIPKTCFALLKSIETNPDSPYVDHSFYLKAKSRYFYENYVHEIGEILAQMAESPVKAKFLSAYRSKCEQYRQDAEIM